MSLALINGLFTTIGTQETQRNLSASSTHNTNFLTKLLNKLTLLPPPEITTPLPTNTLFISLMEKAVVGSLISLWFLAAWVMLNTIYTLFF